VNPDEPYVIATIHRTDNTDDEVRPKEIITALGEPERTCGSSGPPASGGPGGRLRDRPARRFAARHDPDGLPQMVRAVIGSAGVVTDSGGLQKEACPAGRGVHHDADRIETLQDGWNILDPDLIAVRDMAVRPRPSAAQSQPFADGHASQRVVAALRAHRA
jgi:UDP-N-acetylglucosamine 2-epimerase (non-hydrolysing)